MESNGQIKLRKCYNKRNKIINPIYLGLFSYWIIAGSFVVLTRPKEREDVYNCTYDVFMDFQIFLFMLNMSSMNEQAIQTKTRIVYSPTNDLFETSWSMIMRSNSHSHKTHDQTFQPKQPFLWVTPKKYSAVKSCSDGGWTQAMINYLSTESQPGSETTY